MPFQIRARAPTSHRCFRARHAASGPHSQHLDRTQRRIVRVPQRRKNLDRREPPMAIEFAGFRVLVAGGCRSDGLDLQEPNAASLEPGFGMRKKAGTMSLASCIRPDRNAMDVPGVREVFAQRQEPDHWGPSESANVGMVAESAHT